MQFVRRRAIAGQDWLRVLFIGDTDEGESKGPKDEFDTSPGAVVREMALGGVNLPWNLLLGAAIGLWLLFTRVTLGASGSMANWDHLIGSLVLTVISVAAAEVARPARFLLIPLGAALAFQPVFHDVTMAQMIAGVGLGAALIALSFRRGQVHQRYGNWNKLIV
jgi:hypothetical protein